MKLNNCKKWRQIKMKLQLNKLLNLLSVINYQKGYNKINKNTFQKIFKFLLLVKIGLIIFNKNKKSKINKTKEIMNN